MPNDSTLLYALDTVAEYEQLKIQLCRLIQEGHLQLTKTKYACGSDLLSTTKLPAPNINSLMALTKVNVEFDDDLPSFTLAEREDNQTVTMIRNRKQKKDVSVTDKGKEKEAQEEHTKEKSKSELIEVPSNPLEWYGLLAPTSLQHAQTLFNHSIELCISIANVQGKADCRLTECEREDLNERGIVNVEEEIPALEKEGDIIIVQKEKEAKEKVENEGDEKEEEEKEEVQEEKEESGVELDKDSGCSEKSEGSEENEEKESNSSGDFVVIQGGAKVTDSSDESTVTIHKSEE